MPQNLLLSRDAEVSAIFELELSWTTPAPVLFQRPEQGLELT